MSIRSAKDVKRSLLKRAIKEGRGPEMILLIQWRNAFNKHKAKKRLKEYLEFEENNFQQPRSVRMLNLLASLEGRSIRFSSADVLSMQVQGSDAIN